MYKAGHVPGIPAGGEAAQARKSLPGSVEAAVPRLLLLKASVSRTGADWWPHTCLYATSRYDVDLTLGKLP